jgi:hypothetical protein
MSNFRIFSPREVEARIAAGDTLVIFRSHILRLNKWQDVHPGGRLVVQHMVGRDASDEHVINIISYSLLYWIVLNALIIFRERRLLEVIKRPLANQKNRLDPIPSKHLNR